MIRFSTRLIDQRLLALKALEKKLDQEPEVIRGVWHSLASFTLSNVMLEKHIKSKVNDETIESSYMLSNSI